jgi:uncharacterized protein YciI
MKTAVLTLLLLLSGVAAAQTPADLPHGPDIPKNLKRYYVGFLVNGEKAVPPLSKEELAQVMLKHMAFIHSQVEAGKFLVVGPILENDQIRGLAIINASSIEQAKQIFEGDPMVQGGRMAIKVYPAMFADLSSVHMDYEPKASQ